MSKAYFEREIAVAKLFGRPLEMPNKENALQWARRIECDLSPENLNCDGEISRAEANRKYKVLMAAKAHVEKVAGRKFTDRELYS